MSTTSTASNRAHSRRQGAIPAAHPNHRRIGEVGINAPRRQPDSPTHRPR